MLLEEGVCYDQCISWQNYESFPRFILHFKAKFACYSGCFLTSYFSFQSPLMERTSFLGVSSKRSCRFIKPFNFRFFSFTGWGIGLDYHDIEWVALETSRDHSVVFETASNYCISTLFLTIMATPFLLRDSCPQ